MSSRPQAGRSLGGYRIERLLGRGGMGAVYLARDERLGRRVALKVLPPELADDDRFRERFLREWRVAAALEHPHVVPIHDAGEADGQLYIAMRYVEGTDLKELIREESPLEPSRTLKIFSQVADALDAAHARGLVHRDVKPANVLLDQAGNSYLCDFGLTKNVSSSSGLTGTGQLVGTLEYIAPEAIRGDPVDGRADQYSLACLLYECLTGEPPGESWPVNTPERAREHFATVRDPIRLVWDVIHDQRRPLDDRTTASASSSNGFGSSRLSTTPAETVPATSPASPPSGFAASASSTTTGTRTAAPSGGSRPTPTSGKSPSRSVSTRRATGTTEVDWTRLSPRGAAILRLVAIPHSEGLLLIEIAAELKTSSSWVSSRLRELADELEQLTG